MQSGWVASVCKPYACTHIHIGHVVGIGSICHRRRTKRGGVGEKIGLYVLSGF